MSSVSLGDVCEPRTGIRDPRENPERLFRYVDISSVDNKRKRIVDAQTLKGSEAPSRARNVIRTRDVLVSTTRPNLNAVALVPPELDNQICSTGFCVLRAGPRVLPEYLFAFVQSAGCIDPLTELVKGALYPAVNDKQVLALMIPLPPLPEQQRIAGRLREQMEAVERARLAAAERLAAEALPAAYLREVFEGKAWPLRELRDGLQAIEAGTSVRSLERPARDGEWGVLKVSAVSWGKFKGGENKAVPPGFTPKSHEVVRRGDLLISRANTQELAGAVVIVRETPNKLMLSDKTLRLVLRDDVLDSEYLEYAIRTPGARRFIEHNATGTSYSMRNISQDTIRAVPLPVPPLTEQKRIAAELSRRLAEAEHLAERIGEELAAVEALPAALLRAAFGDRGA
ncbi:MAG TPA: restriction endonuclease subunit S [Tepidisphaeraceae bacterium]|jgi:type I restriction enzyme S subunit